jgi:nitrite reductase/ring-hydroxylating ferredoxin subunit
LTGIALCRFEEIGEGEARAFGPFDQTRRKLFVVRKAGELHSWWDSCPHYAGAPLAWRTNAYLNAARDRIVCAGHGAEFEIETGRCVLGAALGQALTAAPVEVTPDGDVVFRG